jgi:hypothetical protein
MFLTNINLTIFEERYPGFLIANQDIIHRTPPMIGAIAKILSTGVRCIMIHLHMKAVKLLSTELRFGLPTF